LTTELFDYWDLCIRFTANAVEGVKRRVGWSCSERCGAV